MKKLKIIFQKRRIIMEDNVVNEVVENEELTYDLIEEVETKNYSSLKTIVGISLAGVAGVVTYKHVVRPLVAKWKAKKEEKNNDEDRDGGEFYEDDTQNTEYFDAE